MPEHFAQHRDGKFSSAIERMVRESSTVEVSGKPEIMSTMALGLQTAEEVPLALREAFASLMQRAEY